MEALIRRHGVVAIIGGLLLYLFWLSRPEWDAEMRLWRGVGDASLLLLYAALALGPAVRLVPRAGKLLPIRRELGIWFGVFAIIHTVLILNGWVRWEILRFMGYEFLPQADRMVRFESGFGLANLMGLAAVLMTLPLMTTSADTAVRFLGGTAWKFVHYGAYTIFALVVLHTAYFLYIHFTQSFHRPIPPANWFQIPFAALTLIVLLLQLAAFLKTVRQQRRKAHRLIANARTRGQDRATAAR